jgi:rubrerythrin
MFTDEDFRFYFRQMRELERRMQRNYDALAEALADPELQAFFRQLSAEEVAHAGELERMAESFRPAEE